MKKLYGDIKMTWLKVVIFALIAGSYTGVMMMIPIFRNTSFQDIGISYEWWVIFAVIVTVNCKKCWEAMLKCFVFFLISQPVVYIIQVIFGYLEIDMAWTYYYHLWLPMTLLTLPGGLVVYFCKKENAAGAIILGIANTIQAVMAISYTVMCIRSFPHHLITIAVCVASIFVMTFNIQKEKKYRIIALVLPIILSIGILLFFKYTGRVLV